MRDPNEAPGTPGTAFVTSRAVHRSVGHGDVEIAYQHLGTEGDPIILLGGIGADMYFWRDGFCNELIARAFQVVRVDNRDAGDSSRITSGGVPRPRRVRKRRQRAPYKLEDMAEDVAAVMDALGWRSAHIVGHSLGGIIAQTLAIQRPERVRSLTSISSTSAPARSLPRLVTLVRLVRRNPKDFLGRPPRTAEEAGDRLVRGHRVTGSSAFEVEEVWLREVAAASFERGDDPGPQARQESAVWATGDLRSRLSALSTPTLVLHGSDDVLVRPQGGKATAKAISDAKLVLIDGMGHDLPPALWPTIAGMIRTLADDTEFH